MAGPSTTSADVHNMLRHKMHNMLGHNMHLFNMLRHNVLRHVVHIENLRPIRPMHCNGGPIYHLSMIHTDMWRSIK